MILISLIRTFNSFVLFTYAGRINLFALQKLVLSRSNIFLKLQISESTKLPIQRSMLVVWVGCSSRGNAIMRAVDSYSAEKDDGCISVRNARASGRDEFQISPCRWDFCRNFVDLISYPIRLRGIAFAHKNSVHPSSIVPPLKCTLEKV